MEQSKEAKEKFIAQVTHEFRTPLNTIYGMVKMMNPKDESLKEPLRKVHQASRELISMTNSILLWEKSNKDLLKPVPQIYSLRMMLDQFDSNAGYRAENTNNQWS